jgi:hypothetical protein
MADISPEILEEVEDCIRRVKAFQEIQGRRIHKHIKRSRKGREGLPELGQFGLPIPEDFRALYHNHNGIPSLLMPMWEQTVFLEFEWHQIHLLVDGNRIMRLEKLNPIAGRLNVFSATSALRLQLDPGAEKDGAVPLVMTLGSLSRNHYIGFDSTLAMLRSVCAAQDAGILRYRREREGMKERGEIEYDPKELWDVIRPFNPRADYWPALIAGAVDWNRIDYELPASGILKMDPEVSRLIFGKPEDYDPKPGGKTRRARVTAGDVAPDRPSGARATTVLFDGGIFADYHQFYLTDADGSGDLPTDWTEDALSDRIACDDGVLLVTTARNMTVPVRVELHDAEPEIDTAAADHVVLGSLRTAGELVIAGCTDYLPDAARAEVPPGNLRAMVVFTGLGTLSEDGLEGEDRYAVHLWPSEDTGVAVLRQWDGAS